MRNYLFILLLFLATLFCGSLSGQSRHGVLTDAMRDELGRNMQQLSLPRSGKPFFIAYTATTNQTLKIQATLGAVVYSYEMPARRFATVRLLLGDYSSNNESRYLGDYQTFSLPVEPEYLPIRHDLWLATDNAYKSASKERISKASALKKNPKSQEESGMGDLARVEPLKRNIEAQAFDPELKEWEEYVRELSAVFVDFPDLFNSSVNLVFNNAEVCLITSEGTEVIQPLQSAVVTIEAHTLTEEGSRISDVYTFPARIPSELPSIEKAKEQTMRFAQHLRDIRNAESVENFYCGPVLFEGEAAAAILKENLVTKNGLLAFRQPEDLFTASRTKVSSLAPRMGMKVIDNRLSVRNYASREKHEGVALLGAYTVDAEGVVPTEEIMLVENGILKNFLNGRIPAMHSESSTGSSRYRISDREILYTTAPGTLHVFTRQGIKPEKLKEQLLKIARADGLNHAYIVRRISGNATSLYRIDVKSGRETLVRSGEIMPVQLSHLRRLSGVSNKESIENYMLEGDIPSSIIYPSALLLEDVEIKRSGGKTEGVPVLSFPLEK